VSFQEKVSQQLNLELQHSLFSQSFQGHKSRTSLAERWFGQYFYDLADKHQKVQRRL
jgi:hypothetical protein